MKNYEEMTTEELNEELRKVMNDLRHVDICSPNYHELQTIKKQS